MQGIRYQYSKLYGDFVQDPELAKFRRYLDYWSWMLYNENWEIEQKIRECNEIVANIHSVPPTRSVYTLMDYPQTYIKKQDPTLEAKIEDLKKLIRRYGKDLTLVHAIANLPSQPEIWARHFSEYTEAFQDGRFGPTNEDATVYSQVPSHADTCSLRASEVDQQDHLTSFAIRHLKSINIRLRKWIACGSKEWSEEEGAAPEQFVGLEKIVMVANVLAGIYVPVFFAACLGVLSSIQSEKWRIVVLGAFGLMLTALLILCVPTLKRSDMFAITGAFFAVGGIFVGARSMD